MVLPTDTLTMMLVALAQAVTLEVLEVFEPLGAAERLEVGAKVRRREAAGGGGNDGRSAGGAAGGAAGGGAVGGGAWPHSGLKFVSVALCT